MCEAQPPSKRLLDQRLRNRMLECFEYLADGPESVKALGFQDYFENFFDYFPYEGESIWPSAMDENEHVASGHVLRVMQQALDDTPAEMSEDDFIATSWPELIQRVAQQATATLLLRGRYDEDREEAAPSIRKQTDLSNNTIETPT